MTPKPPPLDLDRPITSKEVAKRINWLVDNTSQFEPITTDATDKRTQEPRTLELQQHYGRHVWTDVEADQMRRERCLCYACEKLKPDDPQKNCMLAQTLYNICKEGMAVSVTRCQFFVSEGDQ